MRKHAWMWIIVMPLAPELGCGKILDIQPTHVADCGDATCGANAFCDDAGDTPKCECDVGYVGDGIACDPARIAGALTVEDPGHWEDGTYAASCQGYLEPIPPYEYAGSTGDGIYTLSPRGDGTINVLCDMTTDGGGWTGIDPPTAGTLGITVTELEGAADSFCDVLGDSPILMKPNTGEDIIVGCRYDIDLGFRIAELWTSHMGFESNTDGHSDLAWKTGPWGNPFCPTSGSGDIQLGTAASIGAAMSFGDHINLPSDVECQVTRIVPDGAVTEWDGHKAIATPGTVLRLEMGESGIEEEGWIWRSGYVFVRE